jgi:hypothetical protein
MKLRQLKSQVNEGPFDALKKMGSAVADKFTDASGTGEKNQYIKDQQQKFLRWSNQTQNSKDPNNFDNIIKYVVTQLGFKDVAKLYAIAGVEQQQPAQDQQQGQQQQQQPQGPDFSIFRDAAKFKAEWDTFVKQNPNYKLIADPELLMLLKDIWMRTGGTKLEAFLKSGNIVSSKQLYSINKVLEAQGFSLSNLGYAAKKVTEGFVFEALPAKQKPVIPGLQRAKQQQQAQAQTAEQPAADEDGRIEPTADQQPQQQPAAQPQAAQPAQQQQATQPAQDQQQQQQQPAQQDGAAPQQAGRGNTLFANFKNLRAAWEALLDAGQAPTPQVRGVLKDILQTALKTVESVQINELGNRPNDSSDPRTAGGVANAVGNLKDRRRAAGQANAQQPAQAQQGAQQQGQTAQPVQGQSQQANSALQATGKILTPEQTAQVWAEVIRSLYDSGQITSDPGNNPVNRAANVFNTLAGNGPVQSKAGMKWNNSSTMTQDIINSLDSLTPDDARRLAGILSKRAQQ